MIEPENDLDTDTAAAAVAQPRSRWHLETVGETLFGKEIFHSYVKPWYFQTQSIAGLIGAISDIFGNIAPFTRIFLACSVIALVIFAALLAMQRTRRNITGTIISATCSMTFGLMVIVQSHFGGTVTGALPLGPELQEKLEALVTGVDKLEKTTAAMGEDVKASRGHLANIDQTLGEGRASVLLRRLTDALTMADGAELLTLQAAGYGGPAAARLLQDEAVALQFLDRSRSDPQAIQWLGKALAEGLDPDMLVRKKDRTSEGLLVTAGRAGNGPAMIRLLEARANPHGYQDMALYPEFRSFLLAPFSAVIRNPSLAEEEKRTILRLMARNGAVLMASVEGRDESQFPDAVVEDLKAFGVSGVKRPDSVCSRPKAGPCVSKKHGDSPFCDARAIPESFDLAESSIPQTVFLVSLLGIFDNTAYYVATAPSTFNTIRIVSVSGDRRRWVVSSFEEINSLCPKAEDGGRTSCWLQKELAYDPSKKTMSRWGSPVATSFCSWRPW